MGKEGAVGVLGPAGALVRRGRTRHKTFNDVLIDLNPKTQGKPANFSTFVCFLTIQAVT